MTVLEIVTYTGYLILAMFLFLRPTSPQRIDAPTKQTADTIAVGEPAG